jgi:hypothetical protein
MEIPEEIQLRPSRSKVKKENPGNSLGAFQWRGFCMLDTWVLRYPY